MIFQVFVTFQDVDLNFFIDFNINLCRILNYFPDIFKYSLKKAKNSLFFDFPRVKISEYFFKSRPYLSSLIIGNIKNLIFDACEINL